MSTDVPILPDAATLPDDPAVLKQLVLQLFAELQKANGRVQQMERHVPVRDPARAEKIRPAGAASGERPVRICWFPCTS